MYTLGDYHLLFLSLQDQKRVEKVSKRESAIQEVKESVSLLDQLLQAFSRESSSRSNQELVKVSQLTLDTFKNKTQPTEGLVRPTDTRLPFRIYTSAARR